MIWAILLASVTAAPLVAISVVLAMMRAEVKPRLIIREDMGRGMEDWK